jgi:hypothetical protein
MTISKRKKGASQKKTEKPTLAENTNTNKKVKKPLNIESKANFTKQDLKKRINQFGNEDSFTI